MQVKPHNKIRKHTSKTLIQAIERARALHAKFVEDTGIDYKALAASGFDANSGRPVRG